MLGRRRGILLLLENVAGILYSLTIIVVLLNIGVNYSHIVIVDMLKNVILLCTCMIYLEDEIGQQI